MNWLAIILAALGGAIFGSFVNAAVPRLHARDAKGFLFGRSKCLKCKHKLAARDLIPLGSWLFLRGKCRYCQQKIGVNYLLVEIFAAIAFALLAALTPTFGVEFWWQIFFTAVLIFIAAYDALFLEIPDEISLPASVLAFAGSFLAFTISWTDSLIGLLVGGGFFLALVLLSKGRWLGGGDIRLGLLLGALGGWSGFLIALFFAALTGTLVSLALGKKSGSQIPFGPYLAFGGFVILAFGSQIWTWYLGWLLI